jgi:small subunit ribosomal protein S3
MIERTFIKKNLNKMEIEKYLSKKLDRAGFSKLEIIKTPLVTRIVLHVAKPGLAIGKSGSTIKELTETINSKFGIENPQIEIQEIKNPNLDAKILVEKMSSMIERGFAWRSVSFRTIKDIMNAGAQGVELVFKGKLAGKGGRKRKQRIAIGYMKKIGDQAKFVDTAQSAAYPKAGAIGIKLSIIHPDVVFPDKIDVNKVVEQVKVNRAEKEEQAKEAEEKTTKETNDKKEETKTEEKKDSEKATEKKDDKKEVKKDTKEEVLPKADTGATDRKQSESGIDKAAHVVENVVHKVEEVAEKAAEEIKEDIHKIEERIEEKETKKDEKKKEEKK